MNRFWPPAEPPQRIYERLRCAVLANGRLPDELAAARFGRRGLAGLITWPDAEPVFTADLIGAARAAWTPHADPRIVALAATYRLLLDTTGHAHPGHAHAGHAHTWRRDQPEPDGLVTAGHHR